VPDIQAADNEVPCSDDFLMDFLKQSRALSIQIVPSPENQSAITDTGIVSIRLGCMHSMPSV